MRNKLNILFVSVILIISTTGIPFTYHLCQMMQSKSLTECQICAISEANTSSCCDVESTTNDLTFKNPACCQNEFVYSKVEDEFVNSKFDVNIFSSSEILFQPIFLTPLTNDFGLERFLYNDSSPPFLIDPELHITNSILLI